MAPGWFHIDGDPLSPLGKVALGAAIGALAGVAFELPGRWFTGALVGGAAGYALSAME